MADNNSQILDDLQGLNFSEYEARAYLSLLKAQPATAYEVAKTSGIPKANSYTVLDSLCRKRAAQPVSQLPAKYVATPPDVLFKDIAETTRQRAERACERIEQIGDYPEHDYVWSLSGQDAIDKRVAEVIDNAQQHLWLKGSEVHLERHLVHLEAAAERGVKILIVLFGTKVDELSAGGKIRVMLHEGNGIDVGMSPFLISMTRDFEEALIAEFGDQPHGSYTRNRPIVNLFDSLIRHEIYFCEIFEIFGEEISERFGPSMLELRRKYLPENQKHALEALVGK